MTRSIHTTRRFALSAAAVTALAGIGLLGSSAALAQAYPSKPVTIVVPFAAGGTTDILARIIGQALTTELGQSVIVDNRAGAGGNIGGQAAAKAPADPAEHLVRQGLGQAEDHVQHGQQRQPEHHEPPSKAQE